MAEREASEEGEWKSESFAFAFNPCSIDREDCVIRIYVFYSKNIEKKKEERIFKDPRIVAPFVLRLFSSRIFLRAA